MDDMVRQAAAAAGGGYRGPERRARESDHDLLIRIDTRLDRLERDVQDIWKDARGQIGGMDARLAAVERVRLEYPPEKIVPQILELSKEWAEFKTTRKAERRVWSGIAAGVGAGMALFAQFVLTWAASALR